MPFGLVGLATSRGSAIGDLQSIANLAVMTIRPPAGVTWVVEMITFGAACTIAFTDGTLTDTISTEAAAGVIEKASYTITRSEYITVTNTGGLATFGYSGYEARENA